MGDRDTEKHKKIVVEEFCEPLKKKQQEKCVEFYEGWVEGDQGKESSGETDG